MKVFTCNTFHGHWPVGTAAVAVASNSDEAAALLEAKLRDAGLPQTLNANDMQELRLEPGQVVILNDGEY